jgi:diaminohydroxyphosphoribosylaminopyrimidine deaminase/5-amino-6-(5-phosphoribosylamino)uracil reductase
MTQDEKYITRCLELARSGRSNVAPNPMVGCVIVHDEKIIGEGFHTKYGEAHAEVNAIRSVKNKSLLSKSTLYVNLEPCSHYGKTPPCADLIVKHKLKRVVIASLDNNPEVAGKGVKHLKENGIEVEIDVLKDKAMQLNRRFFTFHKKQRPYIILKWAQSADAFLDIERADDLPTINWISNNMSKRLVHTWRAEESAILVGKNTVLKDNPSLTTREVAGPNPIRIVIDSSNSLYSKASNAKQWKIFCDDAPTIVYNKRITKEVGNITFVKIDAELPTLEFILNDLYKRSILSVIIEGGRFTLDEFIAHDLWDEARVIRGLPYFKKGVKAPDLQLTPIYTEIIGGDHIDYFVHS